MNRAATIPVQLVAGLHRENVVAVRLLALCPMLAVSVSVINAAVLGLLTTLVMAFCGALIAAVRGAIPHAVRLPIFLVIVATTVAAADLLMAAYSPDIHRQLGIFLPLITTNCAVLARLEMFASRQPPLAAFADGVGCGCGLLLAIVALAVARELLGGGKISPFFIIENFPALPVALLPVGGFFLFALMIAIMRMAGLTTAK